MMLLDQPCIDDYADSAQSLIDAVTDHAIFRVNTMGIVETWTPAAERIKGFRAADIVGQSFALLYPEEDRAARIPQRNLDMAARFGRFVDNGWRMRKDGSRFRAHVAIAPIRNANRSIVGFAKITRDVGAKHEIEAAMRALATSEQLLQAQKLELMGKLTCSVAHDFNNILAAVISSLDIVAPALAEGRHRAIANAGLAAALRGRTLVSQLTACARSGGLAPQPTELNDFVFFLQPLIQQAVGRAVDLAVGPAPAPAWVNVDQAHLQAAILNIVMNAKAVTPEEGCIVIRILDPAPRRLAGRCETPACGVEIQDFGCGMTESVRARAAEPFFTTKPVGEGTGLGLSQVHGFAEQSRGALEIESDVGKGTIVRILLPAWKEDLLF